MKKVIRIIALLALSLLILPGVFSCTSTEGMVTQEAYDALRAELNAAETEIADLEARLGEPTAEVTEKLLRDEIASLEAQIEELGNEIADLEKQNDALSQEKTSLQTQYEVLNAKYEDLQATLAELTKPKTITEKQVEDEIYALIDQERVKVGVPEFLFGKYLYEQARQNSRDMAVTGKYEPTPAVFIQNVFVAAGYDSVEGIAHGALLTWKLDAYQFEHGALLSSNTYGAVGAYKSGEIVYITLMAAPFQ